jgi:hypothetical protein
MTNYRTESYVSLILSASPLDEVKRVVLVAVFWAGMSWEEESSRSVVVCVSILEVVPWLLMRRGVMFEWSVFYADEHIYVRACPGVLLTVNL